MRASKALRKVSCRGRKIIMMLIGDYYDDQVVHVYGILDHSANNNKKRLVITIITTREASCVIEQSPAAMQLRYLQTLNSISSGFIPR